MKNDCVHIADQAASKKKEREISTSKQKIYFNESWSVKI
jgi:hypothetical protein